MALSVGVRRLSHLPGRGERQVQLSFRGGPRGQGGRHGGGLSSRRLSGAVLVVAEPKPSISFPRLHAEDEENPLRLRGRVRGGECCDNW